MKSKRMVKKLHISSNKFFIQHAHPTFLMLSKILTGFFFHVLALPHYFFTRAVFSIYSHCNQLVLYAWQTLFSIHFHYHYFQYLIMSPVPCSTLFLSSLPVYNFCLLILLLMTFIIVIILSSFIFCL